MLSSPSIQQCPVCSRLVTFSHEQTTLFQCACSSVLQKKDGVIFSKPCNLVEQPVDLIQPGTQGKWNGRTFKVLGRFRAWIEEFVYNYWTIIFDNNTIGYLGEGYGLYAIYEKTAIDPDLAVKLSEQLTTGEKKNLFAGETFSLERRYTCYKWEIEGEVYMPDSEANFKTFEFAAEDGRQIEIIAFKRNNLFSFNVTYTSFASLQLTNTRLLKPDKKIITCGQCVKANDLRAFPYCQSYACIHCGARYVLRQGGGFTLLDGRNEPARDSNIVLGSGGTIRGINYEVIGYALKEENNPGKSQWKEYTLYNQAEGFAFLSEYNGNWTYVRERGDAPVLEYEGLTTFHFNNEPFLLFNRYSYEIVQAAGEFPYNAFNDEDKEVKEFISPPEVWIREKCKSEGIIWFLGEHISRIEIGMAFQDAVVMPRKVGVGAVEPKGYVSAGKIVRVTVVAVLVMILAHVFSTMADKERIIVDGEYGFKDSLNTFSYVTEKFELDKSKSNLRFDIYAPVNNNWFQLNATLVNASSGTEYNLSRVVEYYYGYSEGESWSEGSKYETAYISAIPSGTYFLQIEGSRENELHAYKRAGNTTIDKFSLTITYNVRSDRNLFVCLAFLLIVSFTHYQVVLYNERSRWNNSPFSPNENSYED